MNKGWRGLIIVFLVLTLVGVGAQILVGGAGGHGEEATEAAEHTAPAVDDEAGHESD